tara:strand:- start:5664 stop:6155 length:492 start_codon:yes stop_codon:yes gene_type:complete
MITFRNVVGYLETIAEKHYEINSFHSGFLDEVDINKLGAEDYIILYAEPGSTTIDTGVLTYSFTIYVMDMISDAVGDDPNRQRLGRIDTYSETLQIIQDVINEFKQNLYSTSWVDNQIVLEVPITAEPFTARFDNELTGWSADITVEVNNTNNLCIVPITPNS